jgi:hypothetical protein
MMQKKEKRAVAPDGKNERAEKQQKTNQDSVPNAASGIPPTAGHNWNWDILNEFNIGGGLREIPHTFATVAALVPLPKPYNPLDQLLKYPLNTECIAPAGVPKEIRQLFLDWHGTTHLFPRSEGCLDQYISRLSDFLLPGDCHLSHTTRFATRLMMSRGTVDALMGVCFYDSTSIYFFVNEDKTDNIMATPKEILPRAIASAIAAIKYNHEKWDSLYFEYPEWSNQMLFATVANKLMNLYCLEVTPEFLEAFAQGKKSFNKTKLYRLAPPSLSVDGFQLDGASAQSLLYPVLAQVMFTANARSLGVAALASLWVPVTSPPGP